VWLQLLFGVGAVGYVMVERSPIGRRRRALDVRKRKTVRRPTAVSVTNDPGAELRVSALTVSFGGVVAVDGVSFAVPPGQVTGLIGPNGAGKTTTFNACSGLGRPAGGRVCLDGVDVTTVSAPARARRGIARTFQQTELFDSLTVLDNVRLGREAAFAGVRPWSHLMGTRRQQTIVDMSAWAAIERCGIESLAHASTATLSTGQRRLVELARCLAGSPRVILLDEPSAGLDRVESAGFGRIIVGLARECGLGILLVEHDMTLVTEVCDYLYVLDFGELITEGPTADVLASPTVRAVYLGESEESITTNELVTP
jgi:ABC-type branched-subunit amino acid transport system ATPase component